MISVFYNFQFENDVLLREYSIMFDEGELFQRDQFNIVNDFFYGCFKEDYMKVMKRLVEIFFCCDDEFSFQCEFFYGCFKDDYMRLLDVLKLFNNVVSDEGDWCKLLVDL